MPNQIIIRGKYEEKLLNADIKPTVIIGLGGTGGDVLLRIRKRFCERYGSLSDFPIVSYLWIDTDATENHVGAGIFAEQIRFGSHEKIMATVPDTTVYTNHLNQHPHIKEWFYPGLSKLQTVNEGCGQIRAYSRLSFYHHYNGIRNAISDALVRVSDNKRTQEVYDRYRLTVDVTKPQVMVVYSVAGGTGSGMFLDVAFLVKNLCEGKGGVTSIGYVLLPGLFNPREDRVFANGYAALKELNYYIHEHSYTPMWPDMGRKSIPSPPFNYTYLIERENTANRSVTFDTRQMVFEMVADNIFKDFTQGEFANSKRSVRVNLDQHLYNFVAFDLRDELGQEAISQAFPTRYSSLGMASISVPADNIEQACAYKLASEVVAHWGNLEKSEFNAAVLSGVVQKEVLPKIRMCEGKSEGVDGLLIQRNDIQRQLMEAGENIGQSLVNLIHSEIAQAVNDADQGVHTQRQQGMAQFLRAAADRELAKLNKDPLDPQQRGDYSRTIHFNKESLIKKSREALRGELEVIINQQHQSVGYAIALLRQVVNILNDVNSDYIVKFEKMRDTDRTRIENTRSELDDVLAQTAKDERKTFLLPGQKRDALEADRKKFQEKANAYLVAVLMAQVREAALEVCKAMVSHIGGVDGGAGDTGGLIGELFVLGGHIAELKKGLDERYKHFSEVRDQGLSLQLYDKEDIEERYYPRYIGKGDDARRQIETIGDQVLQELGTSVMDLPALIRKEGMEKIQARITELSRIPFKEIRKDFDVIDTLYKKYPDEVDRLARVRTVYENARFWLKGGYHANSYRLNSEQQKLLVGHPAETADMTRLDDFKRLVEKVRQAGDPTISFYPVPERSEIIFYSEVGGIPVNWIGSLNESRRLYLLKQGEGVELHTDKAESNFEDLSILTDDERQDVEEAHECFLLGVIFGEIVPEADRLGLVRYSWMEDSGIGLKRRVVLGMEARAIAELTVNSKIRKTLIERIKEREQSVRSELGWLARFNALLIWYFENVYPEKSIPGIEGIEYKDQSHSCRAVFKQISAITREVEIQERNKPGAKAQAKSLTENSLRNIENFTVKLVDGKRSLDWDAGLTALPSIQH
jgi:hypothetical protein